MLTKSRFFGLVVLVTALCGGLSWKYLWVREREPLQTGSCINLDSLSSLSSDLPSRMRPVGQWNDVTASALELFPNPVDGRDSLSGFSFSVDEHNAVDQVLQFLTSVQFSPT